MTRPAPPVPLLTAMEYMLDKIDELTAADYQQVEQYTTSNNPAAARFYRTRADDRTHVVDVLRRVLSYYKVD